MVTKRKPSKTGFRTVTSWWQDGGGRDQGQHITTRAGEGQLLEGRQTAPERPGLSSREPRERAGMGSGSPLAGHGSRLSPSYGFPGGSAGKESACDAADLGSIPGLGRSPGEGNSYPLQYSGLKNSMDYTVHGVAKSQTWLSNFHAEEPWEKKMSIYIQNLVQ